MQPYKVFFPSILKRVIVLDIMPNKHKACEIMAILATDVREISVPALC